MTLFQQIALVISFFIIVLILSVMVQNFNTANEFVQEQLYSTANDTATSLGLSLSTVDQDDIASIESMISAIYDSGYYALIRFTDMQGNPLFSRSQQIIVKDLPQWFIDYVELETAEATITVTKGWKHIGLLSVKSHSGHAYYQLWQTLQQVMLSFLVLTLLVLAGIYLLLKIVLRPLKKVQIQAEAVIKNNFVTYEEIPFTTELRDVTSGMNSLVKKVKEVYRNEAEAIEKYHRLLYTDPLTNLKNRKFFSLSLKSYLHSDNRFSNGFIMLLETGGSSQTERSHDDYTQRLQAAARAIEDVTQDEPYTVTCHSRKSEFALILPSYSKEDARSKADTLYASLQQEQFEKINITLTPYHYRESVETILSRADYALNVSISKEASGITFYAEDEAEQEMPIGHDAWAREIQAGLDEKRFVERLQPTVDVHNRIVRQELLLRLVKGSEQLSAHHFMPVIMNLGWMSKIDQYVIEKIITHREDYQPLSINISLDFIRQSSMLHWLKETLQRMPNRPNICFEISNSSLLQDQGACLEFIKIVRSLECGIGLDHFMLGKADLTYLRAIKPDYLKIDADYLLTILESQGGGLTNRSLYTIASMLDIAIIALGIDSEELLERLKANGVSFFQGYYIDKQLYDGEEDE